MKVPSGLYFRTQMMLKFKWLYKSLGNLESSILKSELNDVHIDSPVYVTSLARSGTTIVTEIFSQLSQVCHHTYGDFPGVFTPYWNNWLRQKRQFLHEKKVERSHKDRIMVNNDSPDAFEEVLWMAFYDRLHSGGIANPVRLKTNKDFVDYYRQHIKKHLLIKKATRYLAKANYNVSRIQEILSIFPDAKFIVPIRHPVNHIASLMKQHDIYLKAGQQNPRIDKQLAASGHFEFGQFREVVHMHNSDYAQHVQQLWSQGSEVNGWAQYWQGLYEAVGVLKESAEIYDKAICFVKYESLCDDSISSIELMLDHCQLPHDNLTDLKKHYQEHLSLPDYYQHPFDQKQIAEILQITSVVAENFGYNDSNYNEQ